LLRGRRSVWRMAARPRVGRRAFEAWRAISGTGVLMELEI